MLRVLGAKLNINYGNGSDCTPSRSVAAGERGPWRHPAMVGVVCAVGRLGADVSWLFFGY